MQQSILVTGGAGFIGSCFVLSALGAGYRVVNLDALTYAGNPDNLSEVAHDPGYTFVHGDIGDADLIADLLVTHRPGAVINFAAESHVDRSILDPTAFVRTNVLGTAVLLQATLAWWKELEGASRSAFRFLHVSTDEVYGSLGPNDPPFSETTAYSPNSPYAASKAGSDHFVRSFFETYGLPTLITNCSNNYGPRQFPEKLIPLMILNGISGKDLPVYGKGENIRDWLHVADHCRGIMRVLEAGRPGATYCIGGRCEKTNMAVVHELCSVLDDLHPASGPHAQRIRFVADRPGHDQRYAIDPARMEEELGWRPEHDFAQGLRDTVAWYLANPQWVERIKSGAYREWLEANYANR